MVLDESGLDNVLDHLGDALPTFGVLPFETMSGQFESQPYQFVGPIDEFPQVSPCRYLLLTHWKTGEQARAWLDSRSMAALGAYGETSSQLHVPLVHRQGERLWLRADGAQREWSRDRSGEAPDPPGRFSRHRGW